MLQDDAPAPPDKKPFFQLSYAYEYRDNVDHKTPDPTTKKERGIKVISPRVPRSKSI